MHILNEYCDNIFVITVERFGRKNKVMERMAGIDFRFFDGVDGSLVSDEVYNTYLNNRLEGSHKLSRGMYGCSSSHLNLYKKIYEERLDNVLILEDDVSVSSNTDNLGGYFDQLSDYELVYFGMNNGNKRYDNLLKPNKSDNVMELTPEMVRRNPLYTIEGTNAYFIRNNGFVKELIDFQSRWMFTADGALIEYLKQYDKTYHVLLPQVLPSDDNNESIIIKIDNDK